MRTHIKILGLVPLVCSAWAAAAAPLDQVAGAARFDSLGAKVEIKASSEADGSRARGRFHLRQGPLDIVGNVTCLAVRGNWAAAGGTIVKSADPRRVRGTPIRSIAPVRVGDTFFQILRDNGEGKDAIDESQTLLINGNPNDCARHLRFDPRFDVSRGNYQIHDS
jgi:hypothetical protein